MITIALVSLATALVVICCIGAIGCAWAWRQHTARRHVHRRLSGAGSCRSLAGPRITRCLCGGSRVEVHPRTRREKPSESRLEALQRRFVAGEISLDEYERDIDRLSRSASLA